MQPSQQLAKRIRLLIIWVLNWLRRLHNRFNVPLYWLHQDSNQKLLTQLNLPLSLNIEPLIIINFPPALTLQVPQIYLPSQKLHFLDT